MRCITFILAIVVFSSIDTIDADTINVPADHATIQAAISAAVNGDVVIVAPGTYVENIDFIGKVITVMSSHGPESTVIDGGEPSIPFYEAVVTFENGECVETILDGFTIENGDGNYWGYESWRGGGVCCIDSSPTIRNNIIRHNSVFVIHGGWASGGGIFANDSAVIRRNIIHNNTAYYYGGGGGICCGGDTWVEDNLIYDNSAMYGGGGITCSGSSLILNNRIFNNYSELGGAGIAASGYVTITGNLIYGNSSNFPAGPGGGVQCEGNSVAMVANNIIYLNSDCGISCVGSATLINNTLFGNQSRGIWCGKSSAPEIHNCILWQNGDFEIEVDGGGIGPEVCYCNIEGGWPGTGNMDVAPLFVDPPAFDFHLSYGSPCRDAGDGSVVTEPFDFEGDPRIASGAVDIGADEFYTHLYVTGSATPGGEIKGKLIGLPGTSPVKLCLGLDIRETPLLTPYGDFYLQPPWCLVPLVPIPTNGALTLPATIPLSPPAPYDLYAQALIGLDPDSLTNLCVLQVR